MKILVLFLCLLSWASAFAADFTYLSEESINLDDIPAPPEEGSAQDLADMATVLNWQKVRTRNDCEKAEFESSAFATSFYGIPYGPLSTAQAEKLVIFQDVLFKEIRYFYKTLKNRYLRPRPYDRDPRINSCSSRHNSFAYPSGHAAIAYISSRAFALLYPDKKDEFYARAESIALGRVLSGVHHPTDIEAGVILGEKVFDALMRSEKFKQDMEKLRP